MNEEAGGSRATGLERCDFLPMRPSTASRTRRPTSAAPAPGRLGPRGRRRSRSTCRGIVARALSAVGAEAAAPAAAPRDAPRADRNALHRRLGPETILPGQFADLVRGAAAILPEHRLMLAVPEDAIRCYQMTLNAAGRRSWRRFRETEAWFASDDATWLLSFATICEALDLDPSYIHDRRP